MSEYTSKLEPKSDQKTVGQFHFPVEPFGSLEQHMTAFTQT